LGKGPSVPASDGDVFSSPLAPGSCGRAFDIPGAGYDQGMPDTPDDGVAGVRHLLEHHLDPKDPQSQLIALAYLAGRADTFYTLMTSFRRRERPGVAVTQGCERDAELAAKFGMEPLWHTDMTSKQIAETPLPSMEEFLRLRADMERGT
jgi:hypothetical protein